MVCKKCGAECQENTRFCMTCGAELAEQAQPEAAAQPVVEAQPVVPVQPQAEPQAQIPVQPQVQAQPPVQPQQPVYQQPFPQAAPAVPGKGLAVASLVLGIISILCFPVITGVLAIIFGGVAKSKGFKGGMATAGIVCGVIGLALWIVMLVAIPGSLFGIFSSLS